MELKDRVQALPDRPRVMAVVLTFDAPMHLLACLRGILRQTNEPESILIVDNDSPLPAREVIREAGLLTKNMEFLRLPENLGPAGGYARGLGRFAATDSDAAWVIDDDCVPSAECLSALVKHYVLLESAGLVFPGAVMGPGRKVMNYPAWHGVLIPKAIVEEVGVPREEFFWWAEDTEYLQWRIPGAGYPVVRAAGATVRHYWSRPRKKAGWKFYYEIRNSVYYRMHVQPRTELNVLFVSLIRTLARILAIEDQKLLKLRLYVRGFRDGLAGRLGRSLPVPTRDEVPHPLPEADIDQQSQD
jgi:rhamnopyranosyl-N-acetylglucosaminyl-diphospho-decaprenol beta-1,3/1,4-galactofuranosyltransferase